MSHPDRLGRTHQRPSRLTSGQLTALAAVGTVLGGLALWHLTLVLTAGVALTEVGVTLRALMSAAPLDLPARYDPAGAGPTVALFIALMVSALALVIWWALRAPQHRRGGAVGLADRGQTRRSAGETRAREKAAWTRRASVAAGRLDVQRAPLSEVGLLLGHTSRDGEPVVLTLEDQVAVIAPTGAGKTLYLIVGACLDAPGPLVATSTRPELLDAILEARTGMGTVWVFDPLDVATFPDAMVWDPVAGAEESAAASARAASFVAGIGADGSADSSNPFFRQAARAIIARMLHAAALGGRCMDDVVAWSLDLQNSDTAQGILDRDPRAEVQWAQTLKAARTGADDTVSSIRQTLAQKVEPILSRLVMRQMVPGRGVQVFDPAAFVRSTDTLVLITDDQAQTNVAPLTTMLLGEVIQAAKQAAAQSMTGALDPPMRIVGDEIANVAPLPKLPGLLSDSRGLGVQWLLAFQSVAQILARWGEDEGRQILANLNCSLVMGGLQDEKALDRFSALVGETEVTEVTSNLDQTNTATGASISTAERTALRAEEIRQLRDGQALVIYRNAPAMLIDLIRWTDRPDGDQTAAAITRVRAARIGHRPLAGDAW
jgi:type IV secretion system protein VirD4